MFVSQYLCGRAAPKTYAGRGLDTPELEESKTGDVQPVSHTLISLKVKPKTKPPLALAKLTNGFVVSVGGK